MSTHHRSHNARPALKPKRVVFRLELPFPPSEKDYQRMSRQRPQISPCCHAFREAVRVAAKEQGVQLPAGSLEVCIELFPPNFKRCDLPGAQKVLLDALVSSGLIDKLDQVVGVSARKREVLKRGKAILACRQSR